MAVIARLASALADTPRLKTVHRTVFLTAVSITFHSINKRAPQGYSFIFGGDVQHRNFVNFSKCPETLINLRYNFYDFLNLPLIIPHNDIQTVIFKI